MPSFSQETQRDVDRVLKKLDTLPKEFAKKARRRILRKGAKPLVTAIKIQTPQSKKAHHRYAGGKKVATYIPGNLEESIKILPLRKTPDIYVGPKKAKRNLSGIFGRSKKADGYYAHFVEFGTVKQTGQGFVAKAFEATKGKVVNILEEETFKTLITWVQKNKT